MNEFGRWLREHRNQKGLSREELAAKIGISATYVAKIEQGIKIPSPKIQVRMENFFTPNNGLPEWLSEELQKAANKLGTNPQTIINTLVYQFVKEH